MATKIQFRRGTGAQWSSRNPVLAEGEIGVETDTKQFKIGDGVTAWNSLAYVATGSMVVASSTLDDLADGITYKRIAAAKANKINAGTFSEDDIADGTSYKRVLATVATALNGGTYDAASVTALGLGATKVSTESNLDLYVTSGIFLTPGSGLTNIPPGWNASRRKLVFVLGGADTGYITQIITESDNFTPAAQDSHIAVRVKKPAGYAQWSEIWSPSSDGNGGQPPAPKPQTSIDNGIGNWKKISSEADAALALPAGGQWAWFAVKTTNALDIYDQSAGRSAGGTEIFAASSGYRSFALVWRVE